MPRDFGDWLGDAKPLEFNDPGEYVPPKAKKGEKAVLPVSPDAHLYEGMVGGPLPNKQYPGRIVRSPGKSIADAVREMMSRGFKPNINADTLEYHCHRCNAAIAYPALQAADVLSDHLLRGVDMYLCRPCQQHMKSYRRYP